MSPLKYPAWLRAAAVALLLGLWPAGAALAQVSVTANGPNVISVTELSSQTLDVSFSLLGDQFTGSVAGADLWAVGPHFTNFISPSTPDNSEAVGHVFWLEPGSSLNDLANARFNGFRLGSCFCSSQGPNVTFASDLTWTTLNNLDDSNPWRDYYCIFGHGFDRCPILQDGQSFTTPMTYLDASAHFVAADPLTVTFRDRGDVFHGVPEPSLWAMLIAGFAMVGALLRRRRTPAAKADGRPSDAASRPAATTRRFSVGRWRIPAARLRTAFAATLLAALLGQAPQAMSANFLTMTERPGDVLDVNLSLLGVTQNAALVDSLQVWDIGPDHDGLPRRISGTLLDNSLQYNEIAWLEPGDSFNDLVHARFNVFFLHGSTDGGKVISAFSEVDYASVAGYFGSCVTNSHPTACPILHDGQSFTLPILYFDQNVQKVQGDPLTVTFTDRGDVATGVPEPAAWTLMLLGFGGLGAILRRRRAALA